MMMISPLFKDLSEFIGLSKKSFSLLLKNLVKGPRIIDLLFHIPTKVEITDYTENITPEFVDKNIIIKATIIGHVPSFKVHTLCAQDETQQKLFLRFFRGSFRRLQYAAPVGKKVFINGKLTQYNEIFEMRHPIIRNYPPQTPHQVTPIYPLCSGIKHFQIQKITQDALTFLKSVEIPEWIHPTTVTNYRWSDLRTCFQQIHSPKDQQDINVESSPFMQRLVFDELFAHQISFQLSRHELNLGKSKDFPTPSSLEQNFLTTLPFQFTKCQENATKEIMDDLALTTPMHRLLLGDVGSGKTVVGLMAALRVLSQKGQVAFLAPTDILSQQQYKTVEKYLKPLGIECALYSGKIQGKQRKDLLKRLESGHLQIVVGTHALFQEGVTFHNLCLAIIDEQHRFGVEQRLRLIEKGQVVPHRLFMTATPIPRTLQMAQYGDMDVSVLKEKPPGRLPIHTSVVSTKRLNDVIEGLGRVLEKGEQVFWVCPLIEESVNTDFTPAVERFESLKGIFGDQVGLVHGRLPPDDKTLQMERFVEGKTRILVATTVIEVGVDVPGATVMVIEHAERFGLAQLHQLRGRVGRNDVSSSCVLVYQEPLSPTAQERLSIMRETNDGFFIAEKDLYLRGGGDILGTLQSGLTPFKFADFLSPITQSLLSVANKEAKALLSNDPLLISERGEACRLLLTIFNRGNAPQYKQSG